MGNIVHHAQPGFMIGRTQQHYGRIIMNICNAVVQRRPHIIVPVAEQPENRIVVQSVIQIEMPQAMPLAINGIYTIQNGTYHQC